MGVGGRPVSPILVLLLFMWLNVVIAWARGYM